MAVITEKVKTQEHVGTYGVLKDFLYQDYLLKYFDRPDSPSPEVGQAAVKTLNEVLYSLLSSQEHVDRNELYITSGVAKCMALGTPDDFWKFDRHVDPDIDFRIIPQQGYTLQDFPKAIVHLMKKKAESTKIENGLSFIHQDFEVRITGGYIIPSNFDRQLMQIGIYDTDGKRIIHADIAEFTRNGKLELEDKRAGLTSLWQDQVVAHAYPLADGNILYGMSKATRDIMLHRDILHSESADPADLLEVAFRSLRSVLLSLDSPRGKGGLLDHFNVYSFMPEYDQEYLIRFRQKIVKSAIEGKTIAPEALELVKNELELCFQIDPYLTVNFLRDSGVTCMIPGLQYVTHDGWMDILLSDEFITAPIENTIQINTLESRGDSMWLIRQHDAYRGRLGGGRLFDGLARCMRALSPGCKGQEKSFYDNLWFNQIDRFPRAMTTVTLAGPITVTIPEADLDKYRKDPLDYLRITVARYNTESLSSTRDIVLTRANEIKGKIKEFLNPLGLSSDNLFDRLFDEENSDQLSASMMQLLTIYEGLKFCPWGITRPELFAICNDLLEKTGVPRLSELRFKELFVILKLLGFIQIASDTIIEDYENDVSMYLYSLAEDFDDTKSIVDYLSKRSSDSIHYDLTLTHFPSYSSSTTGLDLIQLMQKGIYSSSSTFTLTYDDIEVLDLSDYKKAVQVIQKNFNEKIKKRTTYIYGKGYI